jgi:hypothetical protein
MASPSRGSIHSVVPWIPSGFGPTSPLVHESLTVTLFLWFQGDLTVHQVQGG